MTDHMLHSMSWPGLSKHLGGQTRIEIRSKMKTKMMCNIEGGLKGWFTQIIKTYIHISLSRTISFEVKKSHLKDTLLMMFKNVI